MIVKVCQYQAHQPSGERLIQVFQPGEMEKAAFFFGMGKTAAPLLPSVRDLLERLKPSPSKIYLLVNALGAGEYWSSNINGDWFGESSLIHKGPVYGYETFLTAGVYHHHCFPADTPVLMSDRTRKSINSVKCGDIVETLQGPKPVTSVMHRHYRGRGISLRLRGEFEELVGTYDHPVLMYRRDQIHCKHKYNRLTRSNHEKHCNEFANLVGEPEYVSMSSVLPGDYLVFPKPKHGKVSVPAHFARLVGWLASEGNLGARGLIQFSFGEDNRVDIEAVTKCLQDNGLHVTKTPMPQYHRIQLASCSIKLHEKLVTYVSGTFSNKTLTSKVLSWNKECLLHMLGAYIDGDGHIPSTGRNRGQLRIRSSSPQMLRILSDVIRSLDVPATTQWDIQPGIMISPTNGKEYNHGGSGVVAVSAAFSSLVAKNSRKIVDLKCKHVYDKLFGDACLVQVTETSEVDLNEDVFNLEVAGPNHFVAGEVVVHNCNKDQAKSLGNVLLSVWHDQMKRVELVVEFDRDKAARFGAISVCDKIDQGIFPDVSMGCRVPYDNCVVCTDWPRYEAAKATFDPARHKSPGDAVLEEHKKRSIRGVSITRMDYCDHLRKSLNKILPDGRKVYAINDYPRFFDISFVFIGADKTAKVMAKLASAEKQETIPSWRVAEDEGYLPDVEGQMEKAAHVTKLPDGSGFFTGTVGTKNPVGHLKPRAKVAEIKAGEIVKDVTPSQFGGKAVPARPDLPDEVLDRLGSSDLSEAISTPAMMGMLLKPREFQRITIIHMGNKPLADELDRHSMVFGPTDDVESPGEMGPDRMSDMLKKILLPFMEDKSFLEPIAKRRVVRITIMGGPKGPEEGEKIASSDRFLLKIAAAYNGYLQEFAHCLHDIPDVINSDTTLWNKVYGQGLGDEFCKTAAEVGPVLGAMGAAEILSALADYKRRKADSKGDQVGFLTDLIAEHPHILAALAGMGMLHAEGSSLPGDLIAKLTRTAEKVITPR